MTHQQSRELKKQIVEYRKQNHMMKEVMEHFGVTRSFVRSACRNVQWDWVRDMEAMSRGGIKGAKKVNGDFQIREANAIQCIAERTPNFEYIGGFTGCDGFVDVKCKTCGTVLHKSLISIRQRHATCEVCANLERVEQERQRQLQKQKEQEERERARWIKASCNQLSMSVCECCGSLFVPSGRIKYCSTTCSKRINNAIKKDRRIRKIRHVVVDKNITLERLYERDNGRCYICGNVCDWDDYAIEHGVFIAYNNYPSIDHIVPISKGGKHEWNNVKLACRGCNSRKSDNLPLPYPAS